MKKIFRDLLRHLHLDIAKQMEIQVLELHKELQDNKGIIPDSWKKWLPLVKLFLKVAEFFTPDEIDKIIEEIIKAIELLENS
jgi:hypothetical protein